MEFINLTDTIAKQERFTQLFGTEKFRSWMLNFAPGDHTDMHYHATPETFLVLEGKASVKGINGDERIIEKDEVVFFDAKDYYQITNVGTGPLASLRQPSRGFRRPPRPTVK